MKKQIIIEAWLIVLGVICILLFKVVGSSLDAQGFLHEPFFLLPIGYAFIALGLCSMVTSLLMKIWHLQ